MYSHSDSFIEEDEPIGDIEKVTEKIENLKKTRKTIWNSFLQKYSFVDTTLPDLGIDEIESYVLDNLPEEADEKSIALNGSQVENNFDLKNELDREVVNDKVEGNIDTEVAQQNNSENVENPKSKRSHLKNKECHQGISTNKENNLYDTEYRLKLPNDMTKTHQLKVLQKFLEDELKSPLKYYYIKLLSSCIRRDKKQDHWRNLLVKEVMEVRKRVNDDDILIYLKGILYPINQQALFSMIEDEYKSNLKLYFDMAYDNISSDKEYLKKVEKEWLLLNETIPEKYLCVYHTILYGVTPIFPELYNINPNMDAKVRQSGFKSEQKRCKT